MQLLRHSKGEDSRTVIASATFALAPTFLAANVSRCNWKREALFRRELTRLHAPGGELVRDARIEASAAAAEPGTIPLPSGRAVGRVVLRLAKDISSRRLDNMRTREQWIVGIRRNDGRGFDRSAGFDVIEPPPDRFYADPFAISQTDHTYVFIEEYLFAAKRGIISVMEIDDNGVASTPVPVLERPYHLSYPFVFRDGADYFMIPETAANRTVELYRAVPFPHRWVLERVLLDDIRALDSSITVQDGRYWLFTSFETQGRNRNDELFLFSADSLGGQWTPHPRNPVVSDVRGARPAGRPFRHGPDLIRPAQDCSTRYGRAVVFQRIVAMNEHEYREETVGTMEPVWTADILGTHTYNVDDRYEVVDGVRIMPRRRRIAWLRAQ